MPGRLSTVRVFSAAGGALTAGASGDVVGASLADISLAPDAATMVTASGSRDHAEAFAPGDLSRRGAYPTGFRPNAVAVSPDNAFAAIGRNTGGADDVFVYEDGGSVPVNAFDLDSGDLVAPRGVAWSGDRKRLFVIAQTATNRRRSWRSSPGRRRRPPTGAGRSDTGRHRHRHRTSERSSGKTCETLLIR